MIRIFLTIVLSVFAVTANAAWYWRDAGNGYYTRTNDRGENDGWYYTKSCSYGCNKYYYAHKINGAYGVNSITANGVTLNGDFTSSNTSTSNTDVRINYSKTWKEDMVSAVKEVKKKELEMQDSVFFVQAAESLGLKVNPSSMPGYGGMGYGGGGGMPCGYQYNGLQTLTQGSAVYNPMSMQQPQQVDWAAAFNMAGNFQRMSQDGANMSHNQMMSAAEMADHRYTDLAKYQAAISGLNSLAQSTATTKTATNQYQATPVPVQPNAPPQYSASGMKGEAMALVTGDVVLSNRCAKCHVGEANKSNFDLAGLANMTAANRGDWANEAWAHMNSEDPSKTMPPPDSGPPLSFEEKVGVYMAIKAPH